MAFEALKDEQCWCFTRLWLENDGGDKHKQDDFSNLATLQLKPHSGFL